MKVKNLMAKDAGKDYKKCSCNCKKCKDSYKMGKKCSCDCPKCKRK